MSLSRSSSHDSFITFEATRGSDAELDHPDGYDDLSTLDDTFTSDDPLASIDSDLAKTKLLVTVHNAIYIPLCGGIKETNCDV